MQKSKGGMRRHGYSLTPLFLFSFEERMGVCLIFSHCPLNHTVIITLFTRIPSIFAKDKEFFASKTKQSKRNSCQIVTRKSASRMEHPL